MTWHWHARRGNPSPSRSALGHSDSACKDCLSFPRRHIRALGLEPHRTRTARTAAGIVSFGIYEPVRLTVQERDCVVEVCEIPDDRPPLIGQIPLEALDFVVDPTGRKLIGNPGHLGQRMIDLF